MAITVGGDLGFSNLSNDQLISTYNPCIIEFTSSVSGGVRAEVEVYPLGASPSTTQNITPSATGLYFFDFNGILKDITNGANNYLEPQYSFPDLTTLSNALFLDNNITTGVEWDVRVYDSNNNSIDLAGSGGYYFLKASTQIGNSPIMNDYTAEVGLGGGFYKALNFSDIGVIAWKGFPIDIQFDANNSTGQVIQVGSTLFTGSLTPIEDERVVRLCLIDDNGIELTNISNNSLNTVEVVLVGGAGAGNSLTTKVEYKIPNCPDECKYFRFKNINGGDSFFLFEDAFQVKPNRKNKENINRRFDSLEDARSREVSLGNSNNDLLVVHHLAKTELENDCLQALILSPVIELWKGGNKWQRVNINTFSDGVLDSKQVNTNYTFSFDLGTKYNQGI